MRWDYRPLERPVTWHDLYNGTLGSSSRALMGHISLSTHLLGIKRGESLTRQILNSPKTIWKWPEFNNVLKQCLLLSEGFSLYNFHPHKEWMRTCPYRIMNCGLPRDLSSEEVRSFLQAHPASWTESSHEEASNEMMVNYRDTLVPIKVTRIYQSMQISPRHQLRWTNTKHSTDTKEARLDVMMNKPEENILEVIAIKD